MTATDPVQNRLQQLPDQTADHGHHSHVDDHPHIHDHWHAETDAHASAPGAAAAGTVSAEQAQLGPTEPGTVLLDIGGDIGSLIIMTPPELSGAEIEISPAGHDDARTHIAIRERRSPGGTRWAGIFPGLRAGRYTVWDVSGQPASTVEVVGGEVVQLDWR